ncbi:DUF4312 family protein [Musicola paradisiaca]|uniref:DUF4312 family protein n=1 Tax=Musicola paradisiaca TaxID=69223 RepID=UPI000ADDE484
MKEQFTTTVHVSGSGDSKAKAFSDALSRVQSTLLRATDKVLLRIEPQDVKVLRAQEQVKTKNFCSFFWRGNVGTTGLSWKSPSA